MVCFVLTVKRSFNHKKKRDEERKILNLAINIYGSLTQCLWIFWISESNERITNNKKRKIQANEILHLNIIPKMTHLFSVFKTIFNRSTISSFIPSSLQIHKRNSSSKTNQQVSSRLSSSLTKRQKKTQFLNCYYSVMQSSSRARDCYYYWNSKSIKDRIVRRY